jgi:subtilisin family serine protease
MLRLFCFSLFFLYSQVASAGHLGARAKLIIKDPASQQLKKSWVARFEGDPAELTKRGVTIVSQVGRVFVLEGTPQNISSIVSLSGMYDIDAPANYQTTLDVSTADLQLAQARQSLGLSGEGAIVAVIDTGLDVRHEDFRNLDGSSRVLFLLDLNQTPEESGVAPVLDDDGALVDGLGGTVYDKALLDQYLQGEALPVPVDTLGHGTHVTGIAASNGNATGNNLDAGRYVGMAPGADIIFVDADVTPGSFSDDNLIRAIQFITERAQQLGRPVVINMSLGGQSGPHDGSGPVEEVIDSLSGPGREGVAFVLSAGNDGDADLHGSGSLYGERDAEFLVPSHFFRNGGGRISFELYFEGASDLSFSVIAPNGEVFGPFKQGEEAAAFRGLAGVVEFAFSEEVAFINCREDEALPVLNGLWKIKLKGEAARFDIWTTSNNLGTTHLIRPLDPTGRVSSLACAQSAIAVASHVSHAAWLQPDGEETQTGLIPQTMSFFSSYGPTRTGAIRPDLSAPGDFVIASMSQDAPPTLRESNFFSNPSDRLVADDARHGAIRGTSMASPHVAGVVALLLSIDPSLDVEEIRRILWLSAKADTQTTQTLPNQRWGYGKLDPFAAAQILLQAEAQELSTERSTVGALTDLIPPDGSEGATIVVIPRDELGVPLGPGHSVTLRVNVRDSRSNISFALRVIQAIDEGDGVYSAVIVGEPQKQFGDPPLIADIHAQVDGIELQGAPSVAFAFDRREVGRFREFSGGTCGVSPVGSLGGSGWVLLLLLLLRRRKS